MPHWRQVNRLRAKVDRAEKHIRELETQWSDFSSTAYVVHVEDDLDRGHRIWTLKHAWEVPVEISLLVGDAVHNLRSALDHICHYLVSLETAGAGPFENLYFPIGSDSVDFEGRLNRAKEYKSRSKGLVKRLGPDAVKAMQELEPYAGGKGELFWHLQHLDIIDKHRLLLTIGSRNPSHSMLRSVIAQYKHALGIDDQEFTPEQEAVIFQTEPSATFPLRVGERLASVPIADANDQMYFRFDVAFGEPESIKGQAVIPTLYQIAQRIRHVIRGFDERGLLG